MAAVLPCCVQQLLSCPGGPSRVPGWLASSPVPGRAGSSGSQPLSPPPLARGKPSSRRSLCHRQQVLALPRRSAAAVRLGVRPDVCHGPLGRVGQLRPRALWDSLLHHVESLEQGGQALHPRPLHLLLPSPLPPHPRLLLADPLDGAGVPESRQAAHVPPAQSPQRARPHREGRGGLGVLRGAHCPQVNVAGPLLPGCLSLLMNSPGVCISVGNNTFLHV